MNADICCFCSAEQICDALQVLINLATVVILTKTLCENRFFHNQSTLTNMTSQITQMYTSISFSDSDGNTHSLAEWERLRKNNIRLSIKDEDYRVFMQSVLVLNTLVINYLRTGKRLNKVESQSHFQFSKIYTEILQTLFNAHMQDDISLIGDMQQSMSKDDSSEDGVRTRKTQDIIDCSSAKKMLENEIREYNC